jgi:hypothetical protein
MPMMAGSLRWAAVADTCINNQNFDPNTAPSAAPGMHTECSARGTSAERCDSGGGDGAEQDGRWIAARDLRHLRRQGVRQHRRRPRWIKYLQTNKIEVDGTLVGDSALPVLGFLDRIHLPLMMRDNVLPRMEDATGGNFDSEFRSERVSRRALRRSRRGAQPYTLGYYTQEPFIDGKYRTLEVKVLRPNLT